METTKDVKTVLVELLCDACGEPMDMDNPEVVWDNKGTKSFDDDTVSYTYSCTSDTCNDEISSPKKYPFTRYEDV